jgi:hypothetical protein
LFYKPFQTILNKIKPTKDKTVNKEVFSGRNPCHGFRMRGMNGKQYENDI